MRKGQVTVVRVVRREESEKDSLEKRCCFSKAAHEVGWDESESGSTQHLPKSLPATSVCKILLKIASDDNKPLSAVSRLLSAVMRLEYF